MVDREASPLSAVRLVNLQGGGQPRQLSFVEQNTRECPFDIARVYWLHNLMPNNVRGFHAHKNLQQLLVCVSGGVRVKLTDGVSVEEYILGKATVGLYLDAGLWRELYPLRADTTIMVLASLQYDEADYIRNYEEYLDYVKMMSWGGGDER